MTSLSFEIANERPQDAADIETLHEISFGPGRFARTAFRLREGIPFVDALGFVALEEGRMIGSVRFSPISIGDKPALLLGPLAVLPAYKAKGAGKALVRAGMAAAVKRDEVAVLLVGDHPYYGPLGFHQVPFGSITLPGPVDPLRILVAPLKEGVLSSLSGAVEGRRI
ncbi:MAG: N-acetyltransferase [Hyphomicrobiales bacterium]